MLPLPPVAEAAQGGGYLRPLDIHPGAIVQPSGQPMRRSVSTGVRRRTCDEVRQVAQCGSPISWHTHGHDVALGDGLGVGRPAVVPEVVEGSDAVRDEVVVGVVVSNSLSLSGEDAASDSSAASSCGGSALPRLAARRRMPLAARPDSENLGGALGCNTSVRVVGTAAQREDEDPPSALGHSEVASVENPVRHAVPELDHRVEERPKVAAGMAGEESRNVLEEEGPRSVSLHKVEEGEGEDASLASEPLALPGDGEVLAGEAACPEVCGAPVITIGIRSLIGLAASIGRPSCSTFTVGSP